ncbi:MAG: DUF3071 domain-containing protein [Candidatus Ancillula sp.]|jgi:hypothetical protein|nr:DUF3071 domain-containing protein [Candidatus Ancillula sp.]
MKELKFKSVDNQRKAVVLVDDKKTEYYFKISDTLLNTLEKEKTPATPTKPSKKAPVVENNDSADPNADVDFQPSVAKSHELSPREIQQYIREGLSAKVLSNRYNVPLEKVQRYSEQVEHEKAIIINLFHHLPARSERRGRNLIDLVNEYFDENDVERMDAKWSVTREGRKPWRIKVLFKAGSAARYAEWSWDQKRAIISENNEIAKDITQYSLDTVDENGAESAPSPSVAESFKPRERHANSSVSAPDPSISRLNTGGLRLARLQEIRHQLDENFDELESHKPELSLFSNKVVSTFHSPETLQRLESVADEEKTDAEEKPAEKPVEKPTSASDAVPIAVTESAPVVEIKDVKATEIASASDIEVVPAPVRNNPYEVSPPTSETDVSSLNVTGRLRAKFVRPGKSKRHHVPSWDQVMLSGTTKTTEETPDEE